MDEEIDIRPYVEYLLKRWYLILGAAVLAALVIYGLTSRLPPVYEATALVAVSEPRQRVQFDSRFVAIPDERPVRAYPELAESDELLQDLLEQVKSEVEDLKTIEQLRGLVNAESGSDPSLIRMAVTHPVASEAALIANHWAELFVHRANAIFGGQNDSQVQFYEDQLLLVKQELETAEEALVMFQSRNRAVIIENELNALHELQAEYVADQSAIASLIGDVEGLRDHLSGQPENSTVTLADQLTALFLQLKAFDAQFGAEATSPLQLQIGPGDSLSDSSRREQLAYLDSLVDTLNARMAAMEGKLTDLELRILSLQQSGQEAEAELARLERDRDVARETYTALARKVDEEQITSQDISSGVTLASRASVPLSPTGQRKMLFVAGAFVAAAALATAILLLSKWLKDRSQEPLAD